MMKQRAPLKRHIQNESGLITVDFIFSFSLVFGLTMVMLALSLTLSVIEITQYVTFAAARNYIAAHVSPAKQTELGTKKLNELKNHPVFRPLYRAGWFELTAPEIGPQADAGFMAEYGENLEDTAFTGVRVGLNAKVLEYRLPFFGQTYDQEDTFTTRISTFLIREPTFTECMDFNATRYNALRQLDASYQIAPSSDGAYAVLGDNGC